MTGRKSVRAERTISPSMVSRVPTVFLSSTFYDLQQVRANIAQFVQDELRYGLLASEHPSLPVDPTITAVENCRRRVRMIADIFILIVGARYGSRIPTGTRSITNIKYLAARTKGIPIFAFVTKEVITMTRLLEANPALDFELRRFDDAIRFVREIRGSDGVWSFGFDYARNRCDPPSSIRLPNVARSRCPLAAVRHR